jgi:hypothetical protein
MQVQAFAAEGCSNSEIARRLSIGRNTAAKYRDGDPASLSRHGFKRGKLDPYHDHIMDCLEKGLGKSETVKSICEVGYDGGKTNAFKYLKKVERATGRSFEPQPHVRTGTEPMKHKAGSKGRRADYVTRNGVFGHVWMNRELSPGHREHVFERHPALNEVHKCVKEFRRIFDRKNVPLLHLFIERYGASDVKEIRSFARGLNRDIEAVENAVAYGFSNGFVEGTNNKLKMIKRTMFGRCRTSLLSAKMMLGRRALNG